MGSIDHSPRHQQICWSAAGDKKQPLAVITAKDEDQDQDRVLQGLYRATPRPGCDPSVEFLSAHPMLSDTGFMLRLKAFHEALVKAVVNIVDRWWEDGTADFPSRMPLEAPLEDILQWIHEQSKGGSMPAFADRLGNWRPDFVLTDNDSSVPGGGFQICEINSRTPHNAIIFSAYKHGALQELLGPEHTIDTAGEMNDMLGSVLGLFDPGLPIHLVRDKDELERQEFAFLAEKKTRLRPKLVSVSDLRLKPDPSSPTGCALYCGCQGVGENEQQLEQIYQIALSLFTDEFSLLPQDMLRYLAKTGVNDIRTTLLVNDERFLGIVLQEVENLVNKQNILTPEAGEILREGIVPTILPGSPELKSKRLGTKNDYILKASRQSRGRGHVLGEELSEEEWEVHLLNMQDPSIRADTTSYVLQPYVRQPKFDIIVDKTRTVPGSYIVGTYYAINGRFLGLGPWRSGNQKICNVFGGSCVLVNSITLTNA